MRSKVSQVCTAPQPAPDLRTHCRAHRVVHERSCARLQGGGLGSTPRQDPRITDQTFMPVSQLGSSKVKAGMMQRCPLPRLLADSLPAQLFGPGVVSAVLQSPSLGEPRNQTPLPSRRFTCIAWFIQRTTDVRSRRAQTHPRGHVFPQPGYAGRSANSARCHLLYVWCSCCTCDGLYSSATNLRQSPFPCVLADQFNPLL